MHIRIPSNARPTVLYMHNSMIDLVHMRPITYRGRMYTMSDGHTTSDTILVHKLILTYSHTHSHTHKQHTQNDRNYQSRATVVAQIDSI